jgi:two-component system OmpR family sensor kinase
MYIRVRLALWFTLILALVLAAFSYGLYQVLHDSLLSEIGRDVQQRATALAVTVRPAAGSTALTPPQLDAFSSSDTYVELLAPNGTVLASGGDLGNRQLPFNPATIARGVVVEQRLGDVPLKLFGLPVLDDQKVLRGYVLVARSPRSTYWALSRLQNFLYPGAALALLLAGIVTWLLVRGAMRPLERLAATTAEIAASQDHTRRVPAAGPSDEIRRLATTINGMLEALDSAYRQVQDVNDLQRHFLADVSHELRTPLTIMLSSLDLMSKIGPTDPDFQARTLDDMRVEADRMARMVTQLLMLARTNANLAQAQGPILLVDVVSDVCRQAGANGGVPVTCHDLAVLEGAVVWGNADYLKQLFLILVDNACKYTPAGGCVQVSGTLDAENASITIADTGIGIAEADLPHIFDRFYRAGNARNQPGTGLGLAIAQRIAEQHGGQIRVSSALGAGSRFTVAVPLLDQARLRSKIHPVGTATLARSGVSALAPPASVS